jgi:hypothetical protein
MGHEKKTLAEMIGELLREAGLLVGVFIPLDMMFSEKPIPHKILGFGAMVFLLCTSLGIMIEIRRKP